MPSYAPRNEPIRKVEILNRKINELKRCVVRGFSEEKTINTAEKVRVAYLNLLKAKLNLNSPYKKDDDTQELVLIREKIRNDIAKWEEIEVSEIIDQYQEK